MKYEVQVQKNLQEFYSDSKSWEDKSAFLDLIDQFQKSGQLSYTTKILVENAAIFRVFYFKNEVSAQKYISSLSENKILNWSLLEKCGYRLQFKTA